MSEREIVEILKRVLSYQRRGIPVGIGDDAAVLELNGTAIWSVDTSVEQVHFRREWIDLRQVARRSFHAAASDLAAMGARPTAALSSLILPPDCSREEIIAIAEGQAEVARKLSCPIVGGNISRGSQLSITLNVIGKARTPLLRSTAKVGDQLWLIGSVGLARAGLLSWLEKPKVKSGSKAARALSFCREAWASPQARIAEGIKLAQRAHAAIDVSDGLGSDADQLACASGVKVVVDAELLRATLAHELHDAARALDREPLMLALEGGEDYALLATGPEAKRPRFARAIGEVKKGRRAVLFAAGKERPLTGGFDHFKR